MRPPVVSTVGNVQGQGVHREVNIRESDLHGDVEGGTQGESFIRPELLLTQQPPSRGIP
jgi:hypothetical protein